MAEHRDEGGYICQTRNRGYKIQIFGNNGITRLTVTRGGVVSDESGAAVTEGDIMLAAEYLTKLGRHALARALRAG